MEQDNSKPQDNPLSKWEVKWDRLKEVQPRKEGLKAVCWLAALGAALHAPFAYLPVKWPLFLMDAFLMIVIYLVLWHERDATKK